MKGKQWILVIVFTLALIIPVQGTDKESQKPARIINLVFDDSGSTVLKGVDTWSQERYAMQLMAAMLDQKDTLNIFLMSSSCNPSYLALPDYVIKGSQELESRVSQVYNMAATDTSGTPFASVQRAYDYLPTPTADSESWLVILTDGNFDETIDVDQKYKKYINEKKGLKIITLAIGSKIGQSIPQGDQDILVYYARTGDDIIVQLAELSNYMFSRNLLSTSSILDFDVPVSELFVLAQGSEVDITGNIPGQRVEVGIQMLQEDKQKATLTPSIIPQVKLTELKGKVAVITPSEQEAIAAGHYDLGISGAKDIKVYFKPYVDLRARLINEQDQELNNDIEEGKVRLYYEMIDPMTGAPIQSNLLGQMVYRVYYDDQELKIQSGDTIELKKGQHKLRLEAEFLKYNRVSVEQSIQVREKVNPIIPIQIKQDFIESTTASEMEKSVPVVGVTILREEHPIPSQIWQKMKLPTVESDTNLNFEVKRGQQPGSFVVYARGSNEGKFDTDLGKIPIKLKAEITDEEGRQVEQVVQYEMTIEDDIGKWERMKDFIRRNLFKIIISLIVIFLVLGYLPPFKKYLPKTLKARPTIYGKPKSVGMAKKSNGFVEKSLFSTLTPYKAQRGVIRFHPTGISGVPKLKVKATTGRAMLIMNYKDYMNKKHIKFDSLAITEANKKPVRVRAGSCCEVSTKEYNYRCTLNN